MDQQKVRQESGTAEWEALCERCGRCCYEKLEYRGRIYYTQKPCPHLDTKANRCRIYAQRSELHPDCVHLTAELLGAGILPADCPYVAGIVNYQAPYSKRD